MFIRLLFCAAATIHFVVRQLLPKLQSLDLRRIRRTLSAAPQVQVPPPSNRALPTPSNRQPSGEQVQETTRSIPLSTPPPPIVCSGPLVPILSPSPVGSPAATAIPDSNHVPEPGALANIGRQVLITALTVFFMRKFLRWDVPPAKARKARKGRRIDTTPDTHAPVTRNTGSTIETVRFSWEVYIPMAPMPPTAGSPTMDVERPSGLEDGDDGEKYEPSRRNSEQTDNISPTASCHRLSPRNSALKAPTPLAAAGGPLRTPDARWLDSDAEKCPTDVKNAVDHDESRLGGPFQPIEAQDPVPGPLSHALIERQALQPRTPAPIVEGPPRPTHLLRYQALPRRLSPQVLLPEPDLSEIHDRGQRTRAHDRLHDVVRDWQRGVVNIHPTTAEQDTRQILGHQRPSRLPISTSRARGSRSDETAYSA